MYLFFQCRVYLQRTGNSRIKFVLMGGCLAVSRTQMQKNQTKDKNIYF